MLETSLLPLVTQAASRSIALYREELLARESEHKDQFKKVHEVGVAGGGVDDQPSITIPLGIQGTGEGPGGISLVSRRLPECTLVCCC